MKQDRNHIYNILFLYMEGRHTIALHHEIKTVQGSPSGFGSESEPEPEPELEPESVPWGSDRLWRRPSVTPW